MKVGFLITARLKSTRLPKKLLKEVNGASYMEWLLRRLKLSDRLDEIVVCTSTNPQDDPLIEIANQEDVRFYRGSEEDVILRLYEAAQEFNLDYVINMTADCPFIPYEMIDLLVDSYKQSQADLIKCHDMAPGMFLSGLKIEAMKRVIDLKGSGFSEYWLYYFLKTTIFNVRSLKIPLDLVRPDYRFILDYPKDHEFLKLVYEGLGPDAYKKDSREIIEFVDQNQEWAKINEACHAKGIQRTNSDETSKVILKDGTVIS